MDNAVHVFCIVADTACPPAPQPADGYTVPDKAPVASHVSMVEPVPNPGIVTV